MENVKTTLAQIELKAGMAYVIQLDDGRFILIDGGEHFDADGARLYRYLCEKAQGEKPVIAAWFFTHGHRDHVKLAAYFMEEYKASVEIQTIAYNIPLDVNYTGFDSTSGRGDAAAEELWYKSIENFPSAKRHVLKRGDVFTFANAKVEIFTTAFEKYPDPPTSRNHTSAALKITFENGKSFLVLGDCEGDRLVKLLDPTMPIYRTDEELKSDILQVPHHGLHVARADDYEIIVQLYRKISPKICLWPQKAERFYNDPWCQSEQYPYNRFLLDSVKDKNFHNTQTVVIDMDDLHVSLWK